MNIGRGLGLPGMAPAEPRTQAASKESATRPAFELPDHGANDPFPRTPAAAHGAPQSAHAHRSSQDADAPPRADGGDESEASSQPASKPQDAPNAAARREARDRGTQGDASGDEAAPGAHETSAPARDDGARRRESGASDDASLPDRMLALLGGEPLPATAATAATSAALPAGLAITPAGLAAAATPGDAMPPTSAAPPPAGALSLDGATAARPAAGTNDLAQLLASAPTGASPARGDTPSDAFAALAALADRARDAGAGASADNGSTTSTTPFGSLLARAPEVAQAGARAPVAAPAALPLMLDADFDDGLGARVTWMAEQRIDHAQIRVSPEALGPIDVRLQVDGHRVSAQFHAANADVRHALESGMDRLRDLLGRQGMELGQAQVGSGARQGDDGRGGGASPAFGDRGDAGAGEPQVTRVAIPRSRGLLDEYA